MYVIIQIYRNYTQYIYFEIVDILIRISDDQDLFRIVLDDQYNILILHSFYMYSSVTHK